MATLDDLDKVSIAEMSSEEAIEYLRQIRLSRRTPASKPKTNTARKPRSTNAKVALPNTPKSAAEMLKILGIDKE